MNILFISLSKAYDPRFYKEAITLMEEGHDLTVVSLNSEGRIPQEWKVRYFPFDESSLPTPINWIVDYLLYTMWILIFVPILIWREKIEAVHVFSPPDFPLPIFYILKKIYNFLLVLDIRDPAPLLAQHRLSLTDKAFIVRILNFFFKIGIKCADIVITVSQPMADIIRKAGREPVIVPNYPLDEIYFRSNEKLDTNLTIGNTIVYVGAMVPLRGLHALIDSLKIVRQEINDAKLLMVGEGDILGDLIQHAKDSGLDSATQFVGQVPYSEVYEYIKRSAVAVVPLDTTPINEIGSPNKIYEYMAAGKAVVCSDLPGLRAIAKDVALFVPPSKEGFARAFINLLKHPNIAATMGRKALTIAEREYRWSVGKKPLIEIYQNKL